MHLEEKICIVIIIYFQFSDEQIFLLFYILVLGLTFYLMIVKMKI